MEVCAFFPAPRPIFLPEAGWRGNLQTGVNIEIKIIMARLKKLNSEAIQKAEGRIANLKAISTTLDLGNDLTVVAYAAAIKGAKEMQQAYNDKLAEADDLMEAFEDEEIALNDLSERMLDGVSSKFGKNSNEYETAGGKKKRDRKRPSRKPKAGPSA